MASKQQPKKKRVFKQKHAIAVASVTASLVLVLILIPGSDFSVTGEARGKRIQVDSIPVPEAPPIGGLSPLTATTCPQETETAHRPVAVMLAGNEEIRPLSGIAAADVVVEMPVVTWGINRLMAIFSCGGDFEIGSVRSARDDYIPIAAALDTIYGHWGGSYLALNELNRGVINNVNALQNPHAAYYRKAGIPAPDNGFTTIERMLYAAEQLGYRTATTDAYSPFPHRKGATAIGESAEEIEIGYFGPYAVSWEYDKEQERYLRSRGGRDEIDAVNTERVSAGTVVTLRTRVTQRYGEYNDVKVTGTGEAAVYAYGRSISGTWEKAEQPLSAPLRILDAEGVPIPFAPGPIWFEYIQTDTPVTIGGIENTQ